MTDASSPRLYRVPGLATTPYAHGAVVPPGYRMIYLAGACPIDADGAVTNPGDFAGQARSALQNLELALAGEGATIQDVVQTRVLVASDRREDLVAVWAVVAKHFGSHEAPSTLLGVTVLGYSDQLVEVEAVAAVAQSSDRCNHD
jgi:enamine deaminase RidA (YjgF/YER057c/UK114 family)